MPIYEFFCQTCNEKFDVWGTYENVGQTQICDVCKNECKKIHSRVSMQPDNYWHGRFAPNVGKEFTSKSQYQKYLRDNNKIVVEKGVESESSEKKAKRVSNSLDKEREKIVAEVIKSNYN